MSAVVITIADAVVTALNAPAAQAGFAPLAFTAERFFIPVYDLQRDMKTLKVSVVPKALALSAINRGSDDFTYQIDVAVQKRIGNDALTNPQIKVECDPLMLLTEQIIDLFRGKALGGDASVQCMGAENAFIYVPDVLDQQRVFMSIATLTFMKVRARP